MISKAERVSIGLVAADWSLQRSSVQIHPVPSTPLMVCVLHPISAGVELKHARCMVTSSSTIEINTNK